MTVGMNTDLPQRRTAAVLDRAAVQPRVKARQTAADLVARSAHLHARAREVCGHSKRLTTATAALLEALAGLRFAGFPVPPTEPSRRMAGIPVACRPSLLPPEGRARAS